MWHHAPGKDSKILLLFMLIPPLLHVLSGMEYQSDTMVEFEMFLCLMFCELIPQPRLSQKQGREKLILGRSLPISNRAIMM